MQIPLDMGKMYDYYCTYVSNEQIFAIGNNFLPRKNEMEGSYSSQVSHEGCSVFQSLTIHIIHLLGLVMEKKSKQIISL